jgi:predicted heme/steroid binding protein
MKLTSSGNNLRGITGPMRKVTMQELRQHCTEKDAWMALRGTVYNITPYLKFHPGGIHELMRGAGADGTYLFDEVHRWVNLEGMMRPTVVGTLDVKRGALGTIEQGATTFASCSVLDVKHHNHNAVQFDLQLSEKISLGLGQHIRLRTKGEYGRIVIREYTPIAPLTTDATDRISLLVKLYPEGTMSDILQGLLDASTNVMTPIDKTTTTTTTSITTTTTATITDTTAAPAYSFTMSTTAPEPVSDGPTPVISPPAPAVAVTPESSRSKEDVVASREMSCSQPCGSIFSYKDMVQVRLSPSPDCHVISVD